MGASWPTPNPSGIESIAWRFRWEDSRRADFKARLLAYNQADCNALRLLTAELQSLSKAADSRADVDFTNKPKQMCTAIGEGIHRAFDGILASAHEEYNRKKIELSGLVVPPKVASQATRTKKTRRNGKKLGRPSKTITVPRRRKCPVHPEITLHPSRRISEHSLLDLAFTEKGCRKKIVKYVGKLAYCPQCNCSYTPPSTKHFASRIYGHGFQSWTIFQRVVLRSTFAAISESCDALFSERVNAATVTRFVSRFAREYGYTERLLLGHTRLASPRTPTGRCCGLCSCTAAARIQVITSVSNNPYQPS